ncbi:MAG: SIS domain-containing protein [Candidatus Eisenbacteria bacterium]
MERHAETGVDRARAVFTESSRMHALAAESLSEAVAEAAAAVTEALRAGNKVLLCGNGGSAADAQHVAAELAGRLRLERGGLPAIALTVNTSVMTALANDYGYDMVFARQVEALGCRGDVLVGISTSGRSPNVVRALEAARAGGVVTVGLVGCDAGEMGGLCDYLIAVPTEDTQRIQEIHIAAGHAICEIVESALFGQ